MIRLVEPARPESLAPGYAAGRPQLLWLKLVADLDTPVTAMLKLGGGDPYAFLLESVEGGIALGRYSAIGLRPDLVWRCRDGQAEITATPDDPRSFVACAEPPLEALRRLLAACCMTLPAGLPPMAAGLFGYLGYDMVRQMERLPEPPPDTLGVPDAILVRPSVVAVFDAIDRSATLVAPIWPRAGLDAAAAHASALARLEHAEAALAGALPTFPETAPAAELPAPASNTGEPRFRANVEAAKDLIRAGDIFQVVLSHRLTLPFARPALSLYRALRRLNPSPFLFLLNFPGFALIGSSPEVLVRLRDGTVTIRPVAGTRPRRADPAADDALAAELLADPKELAEHLMLLDLGRNDVGRSAEIGSVRVTQQMTVERYSHVMHIVSNVTGRLKSGLDALDALIGGFPAGTVSGAPKVRAMQIIDELEAAKRGVYAGAVGYFGVDGAMDTCIALRTAVLKDGVLSIQAGAGIVADSVAATEWTETLDKAGALLRAAADAARF